MQPLGIVEGFDPSNDATGGISDGMKSILVHELNFERFEKALPYGIIIAVTNAARTSN